MATIWKRGAHPVSSMKTRHLRCSRKTGWRRCFHSTRALASSGLSCWVEVLLKPTPVPLLLLSAAYEPPVMALNLVDKAVDREVALNPFAPVLAKLQTQFGVFDQPADRLLQRFRVLRRHE